MRGATAAPICWALVCLLPPVVWGDSVAEYQHEQKIAFYAYITMDVFAGLFALVLCFNLFLLVKVCRQARPQRPSTPRLQQRTNCINTKSLTLVIASVGITMRIASLLVKNAVPESVNPGKWTNTTTPPAVVTTTTKDCIVQWQQCTSSNVDVTGTCCDGCMCEEVTKWWSRCVPSSEKAGSCESHRTMSLFEPADDRSKLWLMYPAAQLFFILGFLLLFQFWRELSSKGGMKKTTPAKLLRRVLKQTACIVIGVVAVVGPLYTLYVIDDSKYTWCLNAIEGSMALFVLVMACAGRMYAIEIERAFAKMGSAEAQMFVTKVQRTSFRIVALAIMYVLVVVYK